MATPVVGLGAGGHAKVLIEILREMGGWQVVGLLDIRRELHGTLVLEVPVLGGDEVLGDLGGKGVRHFFLGVGSTGEAGRRMDVFERALAAGLEPVKAVHPRSVISPSASLGRGIAVMAGAVVNASSTIGENVIINTGSLVDHDCTIMDHAHIAPGARLAGGVMVGRAVHVGAGATILQNVRIGDGAIVGAGAVVLKDVVPGSMVVGVPAAERKKSVLS